MSRRRSAAVAVAGSAFSAVLSLAVVPVFISRLGIEAYGLIGFLATIQTIVQILDVGLAPAVNREVARAVELGELPRARVLLHSMARIYWMAAAVIGLGLAAAARPVATTWFGTSMLSKDEIQLALVLMAALLTARWPIALYQNAAVGAGRLFEVSIANLAMNTLSVLAALSALTLIGPKLHWMFAAQALVSLTHALVMRGLAWRAIGGRHGASVSMRSLLGVWQFSARMAIVAVTGIALTQLDKTLLSRILPLATFGEYMLAATVVGGLAIFVTPLFNTIYPELSALVARNARDPIIIATYRRDTRIFAAFFLPIVLTLGLHAQDIIWLWTSRPATAAATAPIVALLCVGSAINGLMYFPYTAQLAYGMSWIPLAINGILLCVFAPLIYFLSITYGGIGGAAAWAILQVIYLVVGTTLTHRHIALGSGTAWVLACIVPPLVAAAALHAAWLPVIALTLPGSALRVGAIAIGTLLSMGGAALILSDVRASLGARLLHRGKSDVSAIP